jgi:hypothetical protein
MAGTGIAASRADDVLTGGGARIETVGEVRRVCCDATRAGDRRERKQARVGPRAERWTGGGRAGSVRSVAARGEVAAGRGNRRRPAPLGLNFGRDVIVNRSLVAQFSHAAAMRTDAMRDP